MGLRKRQTAAASLDPDRAILRIQAAGSAGCWQRRRIAGGTPATITKKGELDATSDLAGAAWEGRHGYGEPWPGMSLAPPRNGARRVLRGSGRRLPSGK